MCSWLVVFFNQIQTSCAEFYRCKFNVAHLLQFIGTVFFLASLPPSPADSGVCDLDSISDDKARLQGKLQGSLP